MDHHQQRQTTPVKELLPLTEDITKIKTTYRSDLHHMSTKSVFCAHLSSSGGPAKRIALPAIFIDFISSTTTPAA